MTTPIFCPACKYELFSWRQFLEHCSIKHCEMAINLVLDHWKDLGHCPVHGCGLVLYSRLNQGEHLRLKHSDFSICETAAETLKEIPRPFSLRCPVPEKTSARRTNLDEFFWR